MGDTRERLPQRRRQRHRGIAFDGDDTLWHSESHFVDAHARFVALVSPYVDDDPSVIDERVVATERANLAIYGYGAKAFTLSLIESAIELTGGRVTSGEISAILDVGKGLLDHPVELLDSVEEVVAPGRRRVPPHRRHEGRPVPPGGQGGRLGPRRQVLSGRDRVGEGRVHLPAGHGRGRSGARELPDDQPWCAPTSRR